MAADVAQRERSNIKCYVSAFSNIQIGVIYLIYQAGDVFSGAGDQSLTQVQQRSSFAGQEM